MWKARDANKAKKKSQWNFFGAICDMLIFFFRQCDKVQHLRHTEIMNEESNSHRVIRKIQEKLCNSFDNFCLSKFWHMVIFDMSKLIITNTALWNLDRWTLSLTLHFWPNKMEKYQQIRRAFVNSVEWINRSYRCFFPHAKVIIETIAASEWGV